MSPNRYLTPHEYAIQAGTNVGKVLAWIRSGELAAVNLASNRSGRPRYKITPAAIADFEKARSSAVLDASPPRRQRRAKSSSVIEFF